MAFKEQPHPLLPLMAQAVPERNYQPITGSAFRMEIFR